MKAAGATAIDDGDAADEEADEEEAAAAAVRTGSGGGAGGGDSGASASNRSRLLPLARACGPQAASSQKADVRTPGGSVQKPPALLQSSRG